MSSSESKYESNFAVNAPLGPVSPSDAVSPWAVACMMKILDGPPFVDLEWSWISARLPSIFERQQSRMNMIGALAVFVCIFFDNVLIIKSMDRKDTVAVA